MVGGSNGLWQQLVVGVGGGGSWWLQYVGMVVEGGRGEKLQIFFCSKWAKKPKKQDVILLFFSIKGEWVGQILNRKFYQSNYDYVKLLYNLII